MSAQIDVRLDHVTKRFHEVVAVDDLSLDIERGEFFSMLGPSGCGKTTTLRMIGGFEETSSGTIYLGEADVTGLPPYKRDVNTVFQNYALFPHLTVFENVAFGLRRKKVTSDSRSAPGSGDARPGRAARLRVSAGRPSCPAASSSAWRWRGPSSTTRGSCSWTSRSARWT